MQLTLVWRQFSRDLKKELSVETLHKHLTNHTDMTEHWIYIHRKLILPTKNARSPEFVISEWYWEVNAPVASTNRCPCTLSSLLQRRSTQLAADVLRHETSATRHLDFSFLVDTFAILHVVNPEWFHVNEASMAFLNANPSTRVKTRT